MTDVLARDWKALVLCALLAALVWFLVNERRVQPVPDPTESLPSALESP